MVKFMSSRHQRPSFVSLTSLLREKRVSHYMYMYGMYSAFFGRWLTFWGTAVQRIFGAMVNFLGQCVKLLPPSETPLDRQDRKIVAAVDTGY